MPKTEICKHLIISSLKKSTYKFYNLYINLIHNIHTYSGRVFSAPKSYFVGKGSLIAHRRYCGDSCCELSLKLTLFAS